MTDATPAAPAPEATPAPAAPAGEEAELLALHQHDPQVFQHSPTWTDTGKTAAERLYEIEIQRKAQQAAAEAAKNDPAKPAEQPEATVDADANDIDLDAEGGEAEAAADEAVGIDDYTPPDVTGVTWNDEALKPIVDVAARHGITKAALSEALSEYGNLVQQQEAKLAEVAKTTKAETVAALRAEHGENLKGYLAEVDAAFASLPKEFRVQLKGARLADGRPLLQTLEMVKLFHALGNQQGQRTDVVNTGDRRTMLQQELAELESLRDKDISEYLRPYKNTGRSGSDRALEIMREIGSEGPAKPSATDLRAEERKLERLSRDDPQLFQFGSWPGARSPADRLHQIRSGRAA